MKGFIYILEFTSGQRISIFTQVRDIALELDAQVVVDVAERGLAHDLITCAIDSRWAQRNRYRLYTPEATALDNLVDPVLVSIRDIALGHTHGLPKSHPLHISVTGMLDDIYPADVGAVVSLPFDDQVAATDVVLHKLQTTHAALVIRLGLGERVAYLAELAPKYRAAVHSGRTLRYAKVQEMHAQGQSLVRELIAVVLGTFHDSRDPSQVSARELLLEPLGQVTATMRTRRSRRRAGDDVPAGDDVLVGDDDVLTDDDGVLADDGEVPAGDDEVPAGDDGVLTGDDDGSAGDVIIG